MRRHAGVVRTAPCSRDRSHAASPCNRRGVSQSINQSILGAVTAVSKQRRAMQLAHQSTRPRLIRVTASRPRAFSGGI